MLFFPLGVSESEVHPADVIVVNQAERML